MMRLAIARARQVEIDIDIKRRTRISIEDVRAVDQAIFSHIAATIKASWLPVQAGNDIFDELRKWPEEWKKREANVDKPL